MRFAREGRLVVILGALLTCAALGAALQRGGGSWGGALLLAVFSGWIVHFFRDPERGGHRGERLVVSPAGGKIVQMNELREPTFLQGRARRTSIFGTDRAAPIRFGSRVDVLGRPGATVRVRLGELTGAGTTALAELPGGAG